MGSKKRITISWSGGKDVALALHTIINNEEYLVENLHCIINKETARVGLHGVRESLIEKQADTIGIPLVKEYLETAGSNKAYEALVKRLYTSFRDQGITHILFGDIFLEDLKKYREELLHDIGLEPVFPLWGRSSAECVRDVIGKGFQAIACATNEACYANGLLGHAIDTGFLKQLPVGTDPSGENGEFHTFVFAAPYFTKPIRFSLGEISDQTYTIDTSSSDGVKEKIKFYFQDLLP